MKKGNLYAAAAVAAGVILSCWGGIHLYAGGLRSDLHQSIGDLKEAAFDGYQRDRLLGAVVEAGNGIRYASSTEREIDDVWGKNAPPTRLEAGEGAFLLGFLRVNERNLDRLRQALSHEEAALGGVGTPVSDEDIRVAWWSWRLMGTASLMYAGGSSGQSMTDLLGALKIYRALSRSESLPARFAAIAMLGDTLRLARRVIRLLPENYEPGEAWNGITSTLEQARGDFRNRTAGSAKLLKAKYYTELLKDARGRGVWSQIMLLRAACSERQSRLIAQEEETLRRNFDREKNLLECLAAGLEWERLLLTGGEVSGGEVSGYDVCVESTGETAVMLLSPDGEGCWPVGGEAGCQ